MMSTVTGEWPASGVTFDVRRGLFGIPAWAFEEGFEHELARLFAQQMPEGATVARRSRLADGGVRIHWRTIRVVPL